jgi:hypothetical protein
MYIYLYIYIMYMYTHVYICINTFRKSVFFTYKVGCRFIFTFMYIYKYIYMNIHICTHIHINSCYIHIYVYTYIYIGSSNGKKLMAAVCGFSSTMVKCLFYFIIFLSLICTILLVMNVRVYIYQVFINICMYIIY